MTTTLRDVGAAMHAHAPAPDGAGRPRGLAALLESAGAPPPPALRLAAPDVTPWLAGNVMPGVWSFAARHPGPHLLLLGCVHGNEIGGAVVLDRLLRARERPRIGRLTLCLANLDAFCRFDPGDPTASRFLEEDLNRVWDRETLDGPRRSSELRRARALRPVLDAADVVLDLHSMLWPSDALFLVGAGAASARLALALGEPPLVVADPSGHAAGLRLIDHRSGWRAVLLEAGWHWEAGTVRRMERAARRLLGLLGMFPPCEAPPATAPRFARVTETVTATATAASGGTGGGFAFTRPWRGGEVVARAGTLLARDGAREIRTGHNGALLVMPSLLPLPGQTALRLARFEAPPRQTSTLP